MIKRIHQSTFTHLVTLWFDPDLSEYQVRLFGKPDATYYTDDFDDAVATAWFMIETKARKAANHE
jgi:hypothetical protein